MPWDGFCAYEFASHHSNHPCATCAGSSATRPLILVTADSGHGTTLTTGLFPSTPRTKRKDEPDLPPGSKGTETTKRPVGDRGGKPYTSGPGGAAAERGSFSPADARRTDGRRGGAKSARGRHGADSHGIPRQMHPWERTRVERTVRTRLAARARRRSASTRRNSRRGISPPFSPGPETGEKAQRRRHSTTSSQHGKPFHALRARRIGGRRANVHVTAWKHAEGRGRKDVARGNDGKLAPARCLNAHGRNACFVS